MDERFDMPSWASGAVNADARRMTRTVGRVERMSLHDLTPSVTDRTVRQLSAALNSTDQHLASEMPRVRSVSRRVYMQSPEYRGAINAHVDKVVGTGLTPFGETAAAERAVELFVHECEDNCWLDLEGRRSFGALQRLVEREKAIAGDALAVRVGAASASGADAGLQIIPAERVTSPGGASSELMVDGVELDTLKRAVRYWVAPYHMYGGVAAASAEPIDARYCSFVANADFAGQTRGVPMLVTMLVNALRMNDYFRDVEVTASAAARILMSIETTEEGGTAGVMDLLTKPARRGAATSLNTPPGGDAGDAYKVVETESSMVLGLNTGQTLKSFQPQQPTTTLEMFYRSFLKRLSAASGYPVEVITRDFSGSNFSVSRLAMHTAEETAAPAREQLVSAFVRPVFRWWWANRVLRGRLPDDPDALRVQWAGPPVPSSDPSREVAGMKGLLELNLTTHAEQARKRNLDPKRTLEQREREMRDQRRRSIAPPLTPGAAPMPGDGAAPASEDGAPRTR